MVEWWPSGGMVKVGIRDRVRVRVELVLGYVQV